MKITLVSPYSDIPSPGTRIVSACLKQTGHDVRIIFLPKIFSRKYKEEILDEFVELATGSDLIGISLMTNFFDNVVQLTQRLKQNSNTPILWGGIHPTIRPDECLDYADMVCIGEGEETLVELADKMEAGQDYFDTPGMWFRNNEKIIKNKLRPLIQDLNSIPFQDYDCKTHYILSSGRIQKMNEYLLDLHLAGEYMTFPTRGCPFGCTYCCNNTLNKMYSHQKPLRKRSIDNIINELKQVKTKLPFTKRINFDDDAFLTYTEGEIEEFCQKYKHNINLPLIIGGATPTTVTKRKLSLLADAGLTGIRMGIQTGSERTKRLYKRRYSNQQVEKAVNIISEFADRMCDPPFPRYDIILDNPWETEEDLTETLMFLTKLPPPYGINLFSLTFYPATELYEKAKTDGIITDDREDVYRKNYNYGKETYLNKLFFLLNTYSINGYRISAEMMSLLANRQLKPLKSRLLYVMLEIGAFFLKTRRLLSETLQTIQAKNWNRIKRKIQYEFFINK
jgi:radical SAM superfamily enzyme YgiQ (UPF0313 family)